MEVVGSMLVVTCFDGVATVVVGGVLVVVVSTCVAIDVVANVSP